MNQLLALLVLAAALPLLWFALRNTTPELDDNGEEVPAWVKAARDNDVSGAVDLRDVMLQMQTVPRLVRPAFERFGRSLQRFTPGNIGTSLERAIYLCGLQGRVSVTTLLAAKFITTGIGLAIAAFAFLTMSGPLRWVLTLGATLIGFFFVNIMMNGRGAKRQKFIQNKLPDVLDQMSVCVEAGLGFDAAMLRAAKSSGGPLGEELGRTIQDIRLGASRAMALNSLVERSSVQEVRLFARALIQAEKTGIPIVRVLRVQADDARERRRQHAEEQAMKLPVKMLGPLMLCILPALFIVVLGPAVMNIMDSGLTSGA
ncbi:MAG: type II secretion system F family protein [Acidimicrobiales bacterium]